MDGSVICAHKSTPYPIAYDQQKTPITDEVGTERSSSEGLERVTTLPRDVLSQWRGIIQAETRIPTAPKVGASIRIASQAFEAHQKHESTKRRTSFESNAANSLVPPMRFSLRIAALNFSRSNNLLSPS